MDSFTSYTHFVRAAFKKWVNDVKRARAYYMARRRKTKSDDDDDDNKNEIVGTAFTINRCILARVDAADGRYTYLLTRII